MTKSPGVPDHERFVSLEIKLAYLEKTATELNDVVVLQDRRIEGLERQLRQLERHLREGLDDRDLPHDKPPHY